MTVLNLKDWRARNGGLSQKQLSRKSGYCESILSRYECGIAKPSRRFLLALAALSHGLDVDDVNGPKEGENESD